MDIEADGTGRIETPSIFFPPAILEPSKNLIQNITFAKFLNNSQFSVHFLEKKCISTVYSMELENLASSLLDSINRLHLTVYIFHSLSSIIDT